MLVLDTDHFSELERNSPAGKQLAVRLSGVSGDHALAIVAVEELLRGWLAAINRLRDPQGIIVPYRKLQRQVETFAEWIILPWDSESAALFTGFRRQGIRIGTLDLRIACIALVHNATLLTRNAHDFGQVPGLPFENWLD